MKHFLITALLAAVSLTSCSKESEESVTKYDENVSSFTEMNIPEGFDFAGTKTVTLTAAANSAAGNEAKTLLTVQTMDGTTLLKYNRELSKDFEMRISVPEATKEIVVVDGLIKKSVKINSPVIDLNSI